MSGAVAHGASGVTWNHLVDVANITAAVAGIVIATLVAVMPYARRPRLGLVEDADRTQSHVESTPLGPIPYLRILATNARRRRAARGARVIVEGYRRLKDPTARPTTLGHPSLGWPSAPEADTTAAVVIFPGGHRPIGIGKFIRVRLDAHGGMMRPSVMLPGGRVVQGDPHYKDDSAGDPPAVGWYLWLDLAFAQDISDNRDKLPPVDGGYALDLVIGADDGAAQRYEIHVDWDGAADLEPAEVLKSALEHLHVQPAS